MINRLYQPDSYAGDGAQKAFPITFEFVSTSDIRALVRVGDVDTILTPGVGFTVSGTTLTTTTAPASGATLIVYMEMPFTQKTDYRNTGKLSLEVLEKDLDKASLTSQELRDITLRCVKVPVGSTEDPDDYIVEIRDAKEVTAADAATATAQAGIATTKAGEAVVAKTAAEAAQSAAVAAKDAAQASASTASTQAGLAGGYKDTAVAAAGTATTQAGLASGYKDTAVAAAGTATTKAGDAETARAAAVVAKDAAQAAQTAAEAAVGRATYEEVVTGSAKATFTMPFSYDYANKGISVFINGVYQKSSAFSCPDATHVTLTPAASVGESLAFSTALLGGAIVTSASADRLLSNLTDVTQARANLGLGTAALLDAEDIPASASSSQIKSISASVASNALTLGLAATALDFRSATLTDGVPIAISVGALSLVVPSGATLGTINGVAARLALLVAYNAGAPVLCVVNLAGGLRLDETALISPTTISDAADSANVIYSASSVAANSPYRVVGFVDITEAAAGTWATGPTLVQGQGGEARVGLQRSWQDVTRSIGVTYYNTLGYEIDGNYVTSSTNAHTAYITINGKRIDGSSFSTTGGNTAVSATIPPGASYVINDTGATPSMATARELR